MVWKNNLDIPTTSKLMIEALEPVAAAAAFPLDFRW